MQYVDYTRLLPAQIHGEALEQSAEAIFETTRDAIDFYGLARERLFWVNRWHEIAGLISAKFQLTDTRGNPLAGPMKEGDFIRIDVPGPGSAAGDGYDWVRTVKIRDYQDDTIQSVAFQAQPARNPLSHEMLTAHFYGDESSSTFAVSRVGMVVAAFVVDRNLVPNEEGTQFVDKLRNSVAGIAALALFSKIQWKRLVAGMVEKKYD